MSNVKRKKLTKKQQGDKVIRLALKACDYLAETPELGDINNPVMRLDKALDPFRERKCYPKGREGLQ